MQQGCWLWPRWAALKGPGEGSSPQGRTLSGTSHCPLCQEREKAKVSIQSPGQRETSAQELGRGKMRGGGGGEGEAGEVGAGVEVVGIKD